MILELTPDQKAYQQTIAAFAATRVAPMAATIDDEGTFPGALIKEAATLGLLGVTIPRESGGAGLDYVSYALAMEALGRASAVVSVIVSVNNSLVVEPIAEFGTGAQKDRWLRRLASGEAIGAFALSEPSAGSDAANQQTTAQADHGGFVLNGRKVWVANAEAAEVAIVFAATPSTSSGGSPSAGSGRSVSAFLVPFETPGVTRVVREDSLGVRGLGCMDLELAEVRVGSTAMLGSIGDGFQIAMWALDGGRVAIAAQALGVGEAALQAAIAHAKQHVAFGQPIANYQAIQWMLADSATDLDAARLLTMKAADARQRRARSTLEAAMAKLSASEAAHRAADRAMQILASHGYRRGSLVERLFRDVRAAEIYQGTSEVQRMVIADQLGIASGRG
jgi:butyryl-CoA dehydrogenase